MSRIHVTRSVILKGRGRCRVEIETEKDEDGGSGDTVPQACGSQAPVGPGAKLLPSRLCDAEVAS